MKKIVYALTLISMVLMTGCGWSQNKEVDLQSIMKDLFADKYDKLVAEITVNIGDQTEHHVAGTVRLGEGPENAGAFLASDYLGNWQIVWDGNGLYSCKEVEPYHFPEEMIKGCYSGEDIKKDNDNQTESDDLPETIKGLFLQEQGFADLKSEDIKINVTQNEGKYVKGSIEVSGGGAGNAGGFLASNFFGSWELVWHGNGVYECALLESYEFPEDMKEGCYKKESVPTETVPDNAVITSLKQAFADKYNKDVADVILYVNAEAQNHVTGGVKFAEEVAGGMFFATNINGDWEIVWDGNGTFECSLLDSFGFPAYMKEGCI
jgi:hypothetical protein